MTAGLALALGWAGAEPASAAQVVVQIGALTPEVVNYVAKMGQPRIVSTPPNTDILKLISDNCGSANARRSYLPLFLAANAENEDIRQKRYVTTQAADFILPACLYAQEAATTVTTTNTGPQWQSPKLYSWPQTTGNLKLRGQSIDYDRLVDYTSNPDWKARVRTH
jgi:hypothetical protein